MGDCLCLSILQNSASCRKTLYVSINSILQFILKEQIDRYECTIKKFHALQRIREKGNTPFYFIHTSLFFYIRGKRKKVYIKTMIRLFHGSLKLIEEWSEIDKK